MKIKVPLNSIIIKRWNGGDDEEKITPSVGDPVDFSVEAVVSSISGGIAEVDIRFINGERPGQNESNEPDKGEKEPTEEELGKMAEKADMEGEE